MILVAGATGSLGMEVCRLLCERGHAVRAMVRASSLRDQVERLHGLGAATVEADLKDRGSLENACRGAETIVSTASSTISRGAGDSIESVDRDGQIALVDAAERAGARHEVYVSFAEMSADFPLQRAKRAVEARLMHSSLAYTILRPANFMEVWLGPHLGFAPRQGQARVFGAGTAPVSWISTFDVAQFVVVSVESQAARNRVIELGGPDAVSPLDVVRVFEAIHGNTVAVTHVPEAVLEAQLASADDTLQASLAGLALSTARGCRIPMEDTVREFPVRLTSVHEYAARQG
jgi:uncharacterized protein YbjT (DUF2867 family)